MCKLSTFLARVRVHNLLSPFPRVTPQVHLGYTRGIPRDGGFFIWKTSFLYPRGTPRVPQGFLYPQRQPWQNQSTVPGIHFSFNFLLRGLFVLRLKHLEIRKTKKMWTNNEKSANDEKPTIWLKCTQIWQLENTQGLHRVRRGDHRAKKTPGCSRPLRN